ncbi:hypothetical protein POTOM_033275 [Populus tomentosa]|uniref:Uncharacterized protein n=1 Tax=Populus tomentosa TaxID=118781 RepID=A0A8X8CQJ0_POPTO|nr:hypothetical protein POTOM_033275 [Populus tomentosa]
MEENQQKEPEQYNDGLLAIAESGKIYAEEKEVQAKLLERSVKELECTTDKQNDKDCREKSSEIELHSVKHQVQNVKNTLMLLQLFNIWFSFIYRHLEEKERGLEDALNHIQILERNVSSKEAEISQFKAHIPELNLHAEAQASEYKQKAGKFKALEGMVEQVKPEDHFTHSMSSSSNKSEKNAAKSRGSDSPFKCIGLGLAQQIKYEKDEDLAAARLRIEELESLAVHRQKEFQPNHQNFLLASIPQIVKEPNKLC